MYGYTFPSFMCFNFDNIFFDAVTDYAEDSQVLVLNLCLSIFLTYFTR